MLTATLEHFRPGATDGRRKSPILPACSALDSVKLGLAELGMPRHDAPSVVLVSFVLGSAKVSTTIAQESVDPGHHSSPQQITQRPLR
jgi:hypothetical protein